MVMVVAVAMASVDAALEESSLAYNGDGDEADDDDEDDDKSAFVGMVHGDPGGSVDEFILLLLTLLLLSRHMTSWWCWWIRLWLRLRRLPTFRDAMTAAQVLLSCISRRLRLISRLI